MLNRITHTFIHVLDQDEALDFYVGKLGMVVHTDADLGFMRWLTVNLPGQPDLEVGLMLPGPPAYDDATADADPRARRQGRRRRRPDLRDRRLPRDLRGAARRRRRVHPGAGRALLRHRLRAARPVRQPDPLHPAAARVAHPNATPPTRSSDVRPKPHRHGDAKHLPGRPCTAARGRSPTRSPATTRQTSRFASTCRPGDQSCVLLQPAPADR